jgi:hypothetical protein
MYFKSNSKKELKSNDKLEYRESDYWKMFASQVNFRVSDTFIAVCLLSSTNYVVRLQEQPILHREGRNSSFYALSLVL